MVVSPIRGTITKILVKENQTVLKGDTIIELDDKIIRFQLANIENEIAVKKNQIHDLLIILQNNSIRPDSIHTDAFKSEWKAYSDKLIELNGYQEQFESNFNRQQKLYSKGVIAEVEYLKSEFDFKISKNKFDFFKQQQLNSWQSLLSDLQVQLQKLETKQLQLREQKDQHYIKATLDGTIQDLTPLSVGTMLSTAQRVSDLSPNTELVVECYVSSSDIGFLKTGTSVKYQIDAFDNRMWGLQKGKIINVANDISHFNNIPAYKVLCTVNSDSLNQKSGNPVKLQKGMQLTARFFIARRSLFQLLFEKADRLIQDR